MDRRRYLALSAAALGGMAGCTRVLEESAPADDEEPVPSDDNGNGDDEKPAPSDDNGPP